jgi:uncharacterized alpha/beta hydrolase family protein
MVGLISSSGSSDDDDTDQDSSNSGDTTFSEDLNKMVKHALHTKDTVHTRMHTDTHRERKL